MGPCQAAGGPPRGAHDRKKYHGPKSQPRRGFPSSACLLSNGLDGAGEVCNRPFAAIAVSDLLTPRLAFKLVRPKRAPAHFLWAVLIARIYEVFPLLCPKCGGQMRLIAFVTEGTQIRRILDHIGVDSEPPHTYPRRAGHRCGRTVMRRRMTGRKSSQQIGIWRRNRHRITRWTSASIGDRSKRRFTSAVR